MSADTRGYEHTHSTNLEISLSYLLNGRECLAREKVPAMRQTRERTYFEVLEVGLWLDVCVGIGEDDVPVCVWCICRLRNHDQLHSTEDPVRTVWS